MMFVVVRGRATFQQLGDGGFFYFASKLMTLFNNFGEGGVRGRGVRC